jgi:hypothetical protein
MPMPAKILNITIAKPYQQVYNFLAEPENFPLWAHGLEQLNFVYGDWTVQTPDGPAIVRFSIRNSFGILDHYVTLPNGQELYMPMRVIENGNGAEVTFILYHQPGMSFEQFGKDQTAVENDLKKLKTILETEKTA